MKKRKHLTFAILCVCALAVVAGTVYAFASEEVSAFFSAGLFFKSAKEEDTADVTDSSKILAKYNGTPITASTVEYQRNMNVLRSEEAAQNNTTDLDIINNIIKNMILLEEAERQGLAATDEEVEALVESAVYGYSIPEGKKIIDDFCSGAGITFDEYLEIYREQLPRTIARQKLKDAVGKRYCEEHGLEFTKVNPPKEMVAAQEAYIEELFEKNKDKIEYFLDDSAAS